MAGPKSQSPVCQHCGGPIPRGGRPNRKFCKPSCRTLAYRARQLSAQRDAAAPSPAPPDRAAGPDAPPARPGTPPATMPETLYRELAASMARVRELEATVDRMVGQYTELTRDLASSAAELTEANQQRALLAEELRRQQSAHAEQLQKLQPPTLPLAPQAASPVAVPPAAPPRAAATAQAPAAPRRRLFSAGLCSLRGIPAPAAPPPWAGVLDRVRDRVRSLFRRSTADAARPTSPR